MRPAGTPEELQRRRERADVYGVKVYAYCLMTNHVHLLVAQETTAGLGRLMKRLARRQTRYHNTLEGRSGTLWVSRYKSSPGAPDYLLACTRYIDLSPLRAKLVVALPSSAGSGACEWLDTDPCYLALGVTEAQRQERYRQFLQAAVPQVPRQPPHRRP